MMIYALIIIQLLIALLCWKRQFNLLAIFFGVSILPDIVIQIIQYLQQGQPKPYQGIHLALWFVQILCYLLSPTILSYLIGRSIDNRAHQILTWLAFVVVSGIIYLSYPVLAGYSILKIITFYYLGLFISSLILLLSKIKPGFGIQRLLLLLSCLSGLGQYLLINYFSYQNYFLIHMGNLIFYVIIAVVVWLYPRVNRLLPL